MNLGLRESLLIVFCFLISIIIGKAALNINLIIFDLIILIYLFRNKKLLTFKLNKQSIIFFCFIIIRLNLFFTETLSFQCDFWFDENIIFFVGLILFIKHEDLKSFLLQ